MKNDADPRIARAMKMDRDARKAQAARNAAARKAVR